MASDIICPTCGSQRIRRVKRTVTREFRGQSYRVPNLEFEECPDCGERVYDSQAVRKIEAYSPAYAKSRRRNRGVSGLAKLPISSKTAK